MGVTDSNRRRALFVATAAAAAALSARSLFGQIFTTDASAIGTWFNPGVRGQAAPATATTRGDFPLNVNGALSVSKGSTIRGIAGGLEADLFNWKTNNNSPREGTLSYLRYSRDYSADLYITANIRGLVEPDPNTPGSQRFYDTSIPTLASLAADWVRYTNHIVPTYRQGATISDTRDQAILNSLSWPTSSGGSYDKLLTSTELVTPKVKYWEIGNEPRVGLSSSYGVTNSYTFFAPPRQADATHKTDFVQRYAAMTSAMLAEDPTIKVGPALQWLSGVTEQEILTSLLVRQPDNTFLPVDFLGYHPYQKLADQPTIADKETYLRNVYDDHLSKISNIRNLIGAAGRDPNSIALVASEQNVSDWRVNDTANEANMAHALGVIETDFAFARLGLQGAHYWIWPLHPWDGTQYPSYLAFQKLQDHMGDTILNVQANNLDNLHLYTTRDSKSGEIALWGLNFSDSLSATRSTPINNVGGRGKVTRYTLGVPGGVTNLSSSNLASDQGGPTHNVDWVSSDLTGQRLDTLNLTYNSATITLVTIDEWRQIALPGDVNADGTVNALDTTIVTTNNNTAERNWWQGDVTGDGLVNSADAAIVSANQGLAVGNNRWTKQTGNWNTAGNWASNTVPNGVGATAHMSSSITADSDITLASAVTLGQLVFDNAKSYNLTGSSGSLKFQASGTSTARLFVVQGSPKLGVSTNIVSNTNFDVAAGASLQVNKTISVNIAKVLSQSGAGTVYYNDTVSFGGGGQLSLGAQSIAVFSKQITGSNMFTGAGLKIFKAGTYSPGALNTTGSTTVESGAKLTVSNIREASLIARGSVQISASGTDTATSRLNSLTIDPTGSFDIANNKLVIDYTGASPLATIKSYIRTSRGGTGFANANWNTPGGITSVSAAAQDGISFAIGYVDNSFLPNLGLPTYTSFGGQTVDSTSVLVRYTKGADANLDGVINGDDVTIVGADLNAGGTGEWFLGDFDFDGQCDGDDVTVLGALYSPTAPPLSSAQLTAQFGSEFAAAFDLGRTLSAGGAIPEPSSLATIFSIAVLGASQRRHSRRRPAKQTL